MLNWRDIQDRAVNFAHRYAEAKDEDRDAKPFWIDLFMLYGIDPRNSGAFEERVRIHGRPGVGKIDYFSPKKFLIEHKSRGKNLDAAYKQAMDYFDALKSEDRPRYIVISDFEHIHIYDLETAGKKRHVTFLVKDLPKHVKKLAFLADVEEGEYAAEQAINVKAARAIGKLYKALKESQYPIEDLSPLLTRLVFCFFADDTGIFEQNSLRHYIDNQTKEDGSDVGAHITTIFQILDTPEDKRQSGTNETLLSFPYVNGGLFSANLATVFGSREIRNILLECIEFDWSGVSPAIFGSMFQSVMDGKERHDLGAHYTSEENILKVIKPLFLDELHGELEMAKTTEKLYTLWDKVARITLLDPACGCGNFLVIAYRELRRIEIEIIKRLDKGKKGTVLKVDTGQDHLGLDIDISNLSRMTVENMYGIEIEHFPAEVAKLSLWLVDHLMNAELGSYYGKPLRKLPLTEAPHIVQGNALEMEWKSVIEREKLSYIIGNPPFIGAANKSSSQIKDIKLVFPGGEGGKLDYVAGWYKKAIDYVGNLDIGIAFVSTNSIVQGEQVPLLWPLVWKYGFQIGFAHQTFKWSNEASGKAAVFCIIVGLRKSPKERYLFTYPDISGKAYGRLVSNINAYLIDGPNTVIDKRREPISVGVPKMIRGSIPYDGGFLLMNEEERRALILREPNSEKYLRRYGGSREMLNNEWRYCLWLKDVSPQELSGMPEVLKRINKVKNFRESSTTVSVQRGANTPFLFGDIRQPSNDYLMLPRVSSERREYIPIEYISSETIVADSAYAIPLATKYHLGILESKMHMTWMRTVAGRLKSDYRYSNIVYNNFPWPRDIDSESKGKVEEAVQTVLDARSMFSDATLANLYDPLTMPKELRDAHNLLDTTVDSCYGVRSFASESDRLEFLFNEYKRLVS